MQQCAPCSVFLLRRWRQGRILLLCVRKMDIVDLCTILIIISSSFVAITCEVTTFTTIVALDILSITTYTTNNSLSVISTTLRTIVATLSMATSVIHSTTIGIKIGISTLYKYRVDLHWFRVVIEHLLTILLVLIAVSSKANFCKLLCSINTLSNEYCIT